MTMTIKSLSTFVNLIAIPVEKTHVENTRHGLFDMPESLYSLPYWFNGNIIFNSLKAWSYKSLALFSLRKSVIHS